MIPPNPFNPGSPVDPHDFVGRTQDLENFRQKLRQTIGGSLASMSVAGGYGIGKTSFLHKCKAIAEEQNALTIYFSLNEMDELTRERLASILIERVQEKVNEEVILQRISSSILNILKKIKIKTGGGTEISLTEPRKESFPDIQSALTAAWQSLKDVKTAIVFLIDEARGLERNRAELILYLRAVLEQLQISRTPVMIVPAGKLTITGPSGSGFSPLVRTFPPALLENFNYQESKSFVEKKLNQAGITIKEEVLKKIYVVTEGHPFVLTAYLATAYSKLKLGCQELREEHFAAADLEFVNRVLAPFFSRFYDLSGKNNRNILHEIAIHSKEEILLSELSSKLNKNNNEISPHIGKLVQEGAIIRTDRGKYKLFHHLLRTYIQNKQP
ncbi:MAG: BREX system ATP-binding domain-containing protein [Nanoarchaeota archaeon]